MSNLIPQTNRSPAELVEISPEALEVANCYLQLSDARKVADNLMVPVELVTNILARREVKAYINQVFFDTGFNNRAMMRSAMDAVLRKKFAEMEEADVGSNKDISELLALSHKMTMEMLDREIQLEKLRADSNGPKNQVNVQINEGGGDGTKYGALIAKLLGKDDVT
jgi:antitoxin component HigA of HigAB toxin-antitoxin module